MTSFCLTICALSMVLGELAASFILPNVQGHQWVKVGYLNMSDPTQECPYPWQNVTSPAGASCEKRASVLCDSVNINTFGASYQTVCGRFGGYQVGTPDAFWEAAQLGWNIEQWYVDGVSITYGSPGNRQHVYTLAAGIEEYTQYSSCPCAEGFNKVPSFVGSDYYCESGNPTTVYNQTTFYNADVLWDGQLCRHAEVTCCNRPNLPWFCKNFTNPITENLEVRICLDEPSSNENVALEFFELYIQGPPSIQSLQSTTYAVQGQSVQLNCTFGGLPVPNITWTTPNGSIIISQSHFMVQSTNTSTSLTISPLGPGDSGTYNCTASNFIGMSSASIQLIVQNAIASAISSATSSIEALAIGVPVSIVGMAVLILIIIIISVAVRRKTQ